MTRRTAKPRRRTMTSRDPSERERRFVERYMGDAAGNAAFEPADLILRVDAGNLAVLRKTNPGHAT